MRNLFLDLTHHPLRGAVGSRYAAPGNHWVIQPPPNSNPEYWELNGEAVGLIFTVFGLTRLGLSANKPVCLRAPCLFSLCPIGPPASFLLPPPCFPPLTPPLQISAAVPGQQRQRQPGLREDQAGEGGAGHAGGTLGKEAPPNLPLSIVACPLTALCFDEFAHSQIAFVN